MWDVSDRTWLRGQLDDKLKAIFGTSWDELFGEGKDCPPFVSFMRSTENPPYEPVTDFAILKVTTHCTPCSAPVLVTTAALIISAIALLL